MAILVIGAHPDDETFWAGGLIAQHSNLHPVHVLCLTGKPPRDKELEKSSKILGVRSCRVFPYDDFSVGPHIRENVIEWIHKIRPSIIVTHSAKDYHPDHRATNKLVIDAVEWAGHRTIYAQRAWQVSHILLMEAHNLHTFPDVFVDISNVLETKQRAIRVFTSQHSKLNNYYLDFTTAKARLRGIQSGTRYAEAFCHYRLPKSGDFYTNPTAVQDLLSE
ncbi:MAG: PIG-L deacetylase family protein [Candidatus Ranarchaeia archaeon]